MQTVLKKKENHQLARGDVGKAHHSFFHTGHFLDILGNVGQHIMLSINVEVILDSNCIVYKSCILADSFS